MKYADNVMKYLTRQSTVSIAKMQETFGQIDQWNKIQKRKKYSLHRRAWFVKILSIDT